MDKIVLFELYRGIMPFIFVNIDKISLSLDQNQDLPKIDIVITQYLFSASKAIGNDLQHVFV